MPIIASKRCPKCGQSKPPADFSPSKQTLDGLHGHCKTCHNTRNRAYYQANKERIIVRTGAYQRAHPEVARAAQRKYKTTNRDKMLPKVRARSAAWRLKNREKDRAASLRWARNNPDVAHARHHRYNARKYGNGGSYTAQEWQQLKQQYNHHCLCCHKQEPAIRLTVDHVIPITLGGTNDITNIQPLCLSCNTSKGNRHATDYRLRWTIRGLSQLALVFE